MDKPRGNRIYYIIYDDNNNNNNTEAGYIQTYGAYLRRMKLDLITFAQGTPPLCQETCPPVNSCCWLGTWPKHQPT